MAADQDFGKKVDKAIHKAVANAIERHRKLGESIVVYEDGKIITLSPAEIQKRQQQGKA